METLFQYQAREVSRKIKWQKCPSQHWHLNREENLKGNEWDTRISAYQIILPSPNLVKVFSPRKMQRKKSFSLSILGFYTRTPVPPTSLFIFPPSTLQNAPINLENQPHKHFSQSRGELLSLHLLLCFTTKSPYGFVVGYKEPEPRPKMNPKYCPRPIWSLWARAM